MRGATRLHSYSDCDDGISTHAPHAGSDEQLLECLIKPSNFNPRSPCGERRTIADFKLKLRLISTHAPHAGSDFCSFAFLLQPFEFQPTLPMRGATGPSCSRRPKDHDFNPRSPCGERRHEPLHHVLES